MNAEPLVILLAEDDPGHAFLVQRNLARAGVVNDVVHVSDGQAALDFLFRAGAFDQRTSSSPLLMILDINMPRMDGVEVLARIKQCESARHIPVIMLTTTDNPREIERCYELGCSVYITKPVEYEAFIEAIKRLGLLLQVVQVPPEGKTAAHHDGIGGHNQLRGDLVR
jgi:CheY-like chemotaxis protein